MLKEFEIEYNILFFFQVSTPPVCLEYSRVAIETTSTAN